MKFKIAENSMISRVLRHCLTTDLRFAILASSNSRRAYKLKGKEMTKVKYTIRLYYKGSFVKEVYADSKAEKEETILTYAQAWDDSNYYSAGCGVAVVDYKGRYLESRRLRDFVWAW